MTARQLITGMAAAGAVALAVGAPVATGTNQRLGSAPDLAAGPSADSHPDPAGDGKDGPDITGIDVGNDYISGAYVIWVDLGNRSALAGGESLLVFVDSDLNPATGNATNGADYGIELDAPNNCSLYQLQGDAIQQIPAASLTCAFADNAARVEIQPTDLNGARSIDFYVATYNGDNLGDVAPDGDGWFSYTARSGRVPLSVDGFTVVPRTARAGHTLVAKMRVSRDDILEGIDGGTATCALKLGSHVVRSVSSFGGDSASCVVKVPGSAKGQAYTFSITVAFRGSTVTKTVGGTVR